jgi:murein L,D-transpeptidase YcbB/YkuD
MSMGMRGKAGWAALLILAAGQAALADGAAAIDPSPTGALAPRLPAAARSLDLTPPAGLALDPPPDAPAFDGSRITPVAAPATDATPVHPFAAPDASAPAPAPDASAPSDPLAAAIHAALDSFVAAPPTGSPIGAGDWSAARKAIAAFYAERNYTPLWLDGDHLSAHAKSALDRLAKAGEDGLDLAAAPGDAWTDATPAGQAQADIALSADIVAYAMQASGARVVPRSLSKDVTAKPEVADPAFALKSVAAAEDAGAALEAFNPPQEGYHQLRDVLARMRGDGPRSIARFAPGPVLKLGMSDPRVPLIRARFGLSALKDAPGPNVYDVRVASAVAAFQRVHGLPVNGALTEATASALDGKSAGGMGVSARREQLLLANMEMWRWEPRDMGETRVEVNVPDFSLKLIKGGEVIHQARVIVGKPDTPTPIFSNSIKYMLFNPVWRVPESIVKKEMAPKAAEDPSYFERHGYKVTYVGDKLMVEQPPGEANALGRMLFLFPNEHAVYLHDTPQRSLFWASYRAMSHGCVRVESPARLAEILMGGAARGWTDGRVNSMLGDKERTLSLPVPVPVHLEYFTEFVDENGALREREDLYGLTQKVASALAKLRRD